MSIFQDEYSRARAERLLPKMMELKEKEGELDMAIQEFEGSLSESQLSAYLDCKDMHSEVIILQAQIDMYSNMVENMPVQAFG